MCFGSTCDSLSPPLYLTTKEPLEFALAMVPGYFKPEPRLYAWNTAWMLSPTCQTLRAFEPLRGDSRTGGGAGARVCFWLWRVRRAELTCMAFCVRAKPMVTASRVGPAGICPTALLMKLSPLLGRSPSPATDIPNLSTTVLHDFDCVAMTV